MNLTLLGVELTTETREQILAKLKEWLKESAPHQVVTVNPEILVAGARKSEYQTIVRSSDLKITDGAGIVFVAKLFRLPRPHRFTGVDLTNDVTTLAAETGRSVYLLGGDTGVAKKAAAKLQKLHPDVRISGAEEGIPRLTDARFQSLDPAMDEGELLKRIAAAKPGVLLVAFGHPKQEEFIAKYKNQLGASILIGVGGTFDYLAGSIRRAPRFIQVLWLEWLWRLIVQPWRIKRIWTATVVFLWLVTQERFKK